MFSRSDSQAGPLQSLHNMPHSTHVAYTRNPFAHIRRVMERSHSIYDRSHPHFDPLRSSRRNSQWAQQQPATFREWAQPLPEPIMPTVQIAIFPPPIDWHGEDDEEGEGFEHTPLVWKIEVTWFW